MSTFASSFKAEVIRLARKEAKAAVTPVRKPSGANRKALADLKRRVAALEKECRRLGSVVAKVPVSQPELAAGQRARITAKGIRSLRRKLGLTGADFARLLGVSTLSVYNWERKNGPLRVQEATKAAILKIRDLGPVKPKSNWPT